MSQRLTPTCPTFRHSHETNKAHPTFIRMKHKPSVVAPRLWVGSVLSIHVIRKMRGYVIGINWNIIDSVSFTSYRVWIIRLKRLRDAHITHRQPAILIATTLAKRGYVPTQSPDTSGRPRNLLDKILKVVAEHRFHPMLCEAMRILNATVYTTPKHIQVLNMMVDGDAL